ncbi:MAG: hypothetical protein ACI317_01965 [Floccifex porci]
MDRIFLRKALVSPMASPSSLAFVIFWFRSSSFLSSSIFRIHSFSYS